MEQDFGRACRYTGLGREDPMLPTVILSAKAEEQLSNIRILRSRRRKATGVYLLDPDYRKIMKPRGEEIFPSQ